MSKEKMMTTEEIEKKREHERVVLMLMIRIFCRGNHKHLMGQANEYGLCEECNNLAKYADYRTSRCPFMATKTFCSACKVHCYSPEMKQKIKEVMRYAGPRMMMYHPLLCIKHGIVTWKSVREQKKGN